MRACTEGCVSDVNEGDFGQLHLSPHGGNIKPPTGARASLLFSHGPRNHTRQWRTAVALVPAPVVVGGVRGQSLAAQEPRFAVRKHSPPSPPTATRDEQHKDMPGRP